MPLTTTVSTLAPTNSYKIIYFQIHGGNNTIQVFYALGNVDATNTFTPVGDLKSFMIQDGTAGGVQYFSNLLNKTITQIASENAGLTLRKALGSELYNIGIAKGIFPAGTIS